MAKQNESNIKQCLRCLKYKNIKRDFYISYSEWHGDGKIPYCKDCLKENLDEESLASVKNILRVIDKPYKHDFWMRALQDKRETLGVYLKDINFNDSKYENYDDSDDSINKSELVNNNKSSSNYLDLDQLEAKWGSGYDPEEYRLFERKYQILKNNYPEKTSMHTEALLTYIRYRVKEELATAKGDVKEAKEWGNLASKAAQDAKINPSQLSQADLTGGLDTVGQLVRAVEQVEDIIPVLPKFKSQPKDKPDFTIWTYINYARDLEGKPLVDYEDVYAFYEQRKQEYESEFGKLEEGEE